MAYYNLNYWSHPYYYQNGPPFCGQTPCDYYKNCLCINNDIQISGDSQSNVDYFKKHDLEYPQCLKSWSIHSKYWFDNLELIQYILERITHKYDKLLEDACTYGTLRIIECIISDADKHYYANYSNLFKLVIGRDDDPIEILQFLFQYSSPKSGKIVKHYEKSVFRDSIKNTKNIQCFKFLLDHDRKQLFNELPVYYFENCQCDEIIRYYLETEKNINYGLIVCWINSGHSEKFVSILFTVHNDCKLIIPDNHLVELFLACCKKCNNNIIDYCLENDIVNKHLLIVGSMITPNSQIRQKLNEKAALMD
jgi:hypothetical protein